jgi:pyruvate oxidase
VTRWHRVGTPADFEEGRVREVRVGDRVLAVGRVAGALFCVDDFCPHAGGSLAQGSLDDGFLICPLHGFAYDVASGRCDDDASPVAVHPVREGEAGVEVALPG